MAKLSTIEIRIQNTKNSIEKTFKTLERHHKTLSKRKQKVLDLGVDPEKIEFTAGWGAKYKDNWDLYLKISDYEDALDNIKNCEKKLDDLQIKLKSYLDQKYDLEDELNKIPYVPAVEEFLQTWKKEADAYYRNRVDVYHKFVQERNQKVLEIKSNYPNEIMYRNEIIADMTAAGVDYHTFAQQRNYLFSPEVRNLASLKGSDFEYSLVKMLDDEVERKRIDLFARCTNAVGVITDVSSLYVGNNASLNGFVIGEQGKASVKTIIAGGEIQCLHYRVLVNKIKEKDEKLPLSEQITAASEEVDHSNYKKNNNVQEMGR